MATEHAPSPEVREAIMDATYRALCRTGYAGLTTQAIADELGKSKAILHYYYDTKGELLTAFLDHLLERFQAHLAATRSEDPRERLDALIDRLLLGPEDNRPFQTALLDLRAQAAHDPAVRERFRRNDAEVRQAIEGILQDGIRSGSFPPLDAERIAERLLTVIDGAKLRWIVLGPDGTLERTRAWIRDLLEADLLRPTDEEGA